MFFSKFSNLFLKNFTLYKLYFFFLILAPLALYLTANHFFATHINDTIQWKFDNDREEMKEDWRFLHGGDI